MCFFRCIAILASSCLCLEPSWQAHVFCKSHFMAISCINICCAAAICGKHSQAHELPRTLCAKLEAMANSATMKNAMTKVTKKAMKNAMTKVPKKAMKTRQPEKTTKKPATAMKAMKEKPKVTSLVHHLKVYCQKPKCKSSVWLRRTDWQPSVPSHGSRATTSHHRRLSGSSHDGKDQDWPGVPCL